MVAAALVLLMTPGVAFFYGGMVKAKSVISMMMMSFGAIALVAVLWVLYGYSMSFSLTGPGERLADPARARRTRSRSGLSCSTSVGKGAGATLNLNTVSRSPASRPRSRSSPSH